MKSFKHFLVEEKQSPSAKMNKIIKIHAKINHDLHTLADRKEFSHHHQLNEQHRIDNFPHESPLRRFTQDSGKLNRYLVKRAVGGRSNPTMDKWDESVGAQTSHPGNALRKTAIVHHGLSLEVGKKLIHLKKGETYKSPAYISTSTHYHTAKQFASVEPAHKTGKDWIAEKHVAHFHLPKGYTQGRHVQNITHNDEHEMILHRGQEFRKIGTHTSKERIGPDSIDHVTHHHFVPVTSDQSQPNPVTT